MKKLTIGAALLTSMLIFAQEKKTRLNLMILKKLSLTEGIIRNM
jgi:hypothetical protein